MCLVYSTELVWEENQWTIQFPGIPGIKGVRSECKKKEDAGKAAHDFLHTWLEDRVRASLPVPRSFRTGNGGDIEIECRLSFVIQLRWERKAKGITQAQAANLLGVSQQTYAKLETLGANPCLSTIQSLRNIGLRVIV